MLEDKELWKKHWIPTEDGKEFLAYAYNFEFRKFIQPFIEELYKKGINWKALEEDLHDGFLNQWKEKYDAFDGNYNALPEEHQEIYKAYDAIIEKMKKEKNVNQ